MNHANTAVIYKKKICDCAVNSSHKYIHGSTEATYKSQLLYFNHTSIALCNCMHVSLPLNSSSIQGHPNSAYPNRLRRDGGHMLYEKQKSMPAWPKIAITACLADWLASFPGLPCFFFLVFYFFNLFFLFFYGYWSFSLVSTSGIIVNATEEQKNNTGWHQLLWQHSKLHFVWEGSNKWSLLLNYDIIITVLLVSPAC